MLPIASQTAAPIGPIGTNCVDTHGWLGGCYRLKNFFPQALPPFS